MGKLAAILEELCRVTTRDAQSLDAVCQRHQLRSYRRVIPIGGLHGLVCDLHRMRPAPVSNLSNLKQGRPQRLDTKLRSEFNAVSNLSNLSNLKIKKSNNLSLAGLWTRPRVRA
jgi:hypothetical protein